MSQPIPTLTKNRRMMIYIGIFCASLSIVFLLISYSFSHQLRSLYPMVLPATILIYAITLLKRAKNPVK